MRPIEMLNVSQRSVLSSGGDDNKVERNSTSVATYDRTNRIGKALRILANYRLLRLVVSLAVQMMSEAANAKRKTFLSPHYANKTLAPAIC